MNPTKLKIVSIFFICVFILFVVFTILSIISNQNNEINNLWYPFKISTNIGGETFYLSVKPEWNYLYLNQSIAEPFYFSQPFSNGSFMIRSTPDSYVYFLDDILGEFGLLNSQDFFHDLRVQSTFHLKQNSTLYQLVYDVPNFLRFELPKSESLVICDGLNPDLIGMVCAQSRIPGSIPLLFEIVDYPFINSK